VIVITGASDGLGYELAKKYLEKNQTVLGLSRTKPDLAITHIATDLTAVDSIEAAAQAILAEDEKLEALINCAGVLSLEEANDLSATELERVFKINVTAPLLLTSRLMDRLQSDGGDIVNVASTVGTKGYANQVAYGSSKWAMRGFSQNLQVELKGTNSRVISFCPGGFRSKLFEKVTDKSLADPENWMDPKDLAQFMIQILELPKNMEVSEVIINRK
jgi:short-subunit dehydrogenase